MAYLFPFALFLGVAFAVVNKEKSIMWVKLGGCCLMWLAMSIFCELINGYDKSRNLMDYYKYSIEEHTGGGLSEAFSAKCSVRPSALRELM